MGRTRRRARHRGQRPAPGRAVQPARVRRHQRAVPAHLYYFRKGERPEITVRANRGPGVIAAEIDRRLIPIYQATLARIRAHDASEQAGQQARDTLAAYIAGLFPAGAAAMPGHCQTSTRSQITVSLPGGQGGWVKFSGDGREAEFERFRVPAAVALRMLETAALLSSED